MREPQYQPMSDLLMDGKEWQWVFKDEDGKETPITMYIVFEDKMIVEMRAKPKMVMPSKTDKKSTKKKTDGKTHVQENRRPDHLLPILVEPICCIFPCCRFSEEN